MKKTKKSFLPGRNRCKFMFPRHVQLLILICGVLNLCSCKDDSDEASGKYNPGESVTVSNILPESGGILTPVVIAGKNFGTDKTKVKVFFNEREALVINVVNEHIYALTPKSTGGDNTIKVVIDGQNEGVLQEPKFNYIVSSKVTSVAPESTTTLKDLLKVSIDDAENLVICQYDVVKLYTIEANAIGVIFNQGLTFSIQGGCFSRDFKKYYVLPEKSSNALAVILDKEKNWTQEMIYDSENIAEDMPWPLSITTDDEGFIYVYGDSDSENKAMIIKINPSDHKARLLGTFSIGGGHSIVFNPKDKFIYMTLEDMGQIIRFDSRKVTLGSDDWEKVTGEYASSYEDGPLDKATFCSPKGITCDDDNNLYVADKYGYTIRKIDLTAGVVTTFAGKMNGPGGFVNGSAESARFNYPTDVTSTPDGIIYVIEQDDHRLRCIAVQ